MQLIVARAAVRSFGVRGVGGIDREGYGQVERAIEESFGSSVAVKHGGKRKWGRSQKG